MGDSPRGRRPRLSHVFDSGTVATLTRNARSARRATVAVGVLAVVGAAGYGVGIDHTPAVGSSLAALHLDTLETMQPATLAIAHEVEPPLPDLTAEHPVPVVRGTPLDEKFPSLKDWVHPVVGTDLLVAKLPTGMYGADRGGVKRRECSHCGIDLSGPIGRPVVAVARGVVVHIERSKNGRDGRSGRYVRIEHADGALTSYMHLNSIRRGIEVGTRVEAGDQVGTLGATGVKSAAPHLHFALEIPHVPGTHGDHTNTRYYDPAPFLVRATITETVDRSHPEKPAW